MKEPEARAVFSVAVAVWNVAGGDVRQMCMKRGVPEELIRKFLSEQDFSDRRPEDVVSQPDIYRKKRKVK